MKKIFSWIRTTRSNSNEASDPPPKYYHDYCKDEFSDWPDGVLAIGTFGNNKLDHSERSNIEAEKTSTAQDLEEVGRELRMLLNRKHITVEQLLKCLLDGDGETQLKRKKSRNRDISKKSLSFLVRKALLCRGGFPSPPPVLRDPTSDHNSDLSRMEKILRAMLHKKIYPQRPTPKKYLDMAERESAEEEEEENHRSKWVKTDSEYIVLEI